MNNCVRPFNNGAILGKFTKMSQLVSLTEIMLNLIILCILIQTIGVGL